LKKKDDEFDIVTFNYADYTSYVQLDKKLNKDRYKELKNIISNKAWDVHKINHHIYQIPKASVYLLQPNYLISKEFYDNNNLSQALFDSDYTDLMPQLMDIIKNDPKLNVEYNFSVADLINLKVLNQNNYFSITNIYEHFFEGLLIRKSDYKIVNFYEEEELKKQVSLNNKIFSDNLDGHEEQLNIPFVFALSYTFPKEYTEQDDEMLIPIKSTYAARSNGYGIQKDSKHVKISLDALQFIYTNKDASNLLIYGIKNKDYVVERGRAITKEVNKKMLPYGTYANLGNNLIAYPSEVEALNKEELAKQYNEQLVVDRVEGFVPDMSKFQDEFSDISTIYQETIIQLNHSEIENLDLYFEQVNERLYNMGLQDIIDELQKQLDAYLEER
ncbi:MAG: DUF3502 domain-containing protein, partial [Erysipelotrichia bacterium]|nr:DUF3502 domain-containing protein [Erysipelotrichia bacterium]